MSALPSRSPTPDPPPGEPSPLPGSRRRAGTARLVARLLALPRAALRIPALAAVTLGGYLAIVLGRPFLPRGRRDRWGNRVYQVWARLLAWILGCRMEIRGPVPEAPFLLVANHLGYMDILLLGNAAGGTFVAKRELASWPVVGALCRSVGTVFIDREAKRDLMRVARLVEDALDAGKGIVVFPEGTTSDGGLDGTKLLPFRPSLLQVAATGGHPVHYATLRYDTAPGVPPARQSVSWTGGDPFLPHVLRLLTLPGFRATVTFGPEALTGRDRKDLALRLREAMAEQLDEMAERVEG